MSGTKPAPAGPEPIPSRDAERLHAYLERFGMLPGEHRDALVARFVAAAGDGAPNGEGLATRALAVAERDLAAWFGRLIGEVMEGDQAPLLLGRAAFRLCGGGASWPGVLLSDAPPPAFVDALRAAVPATTPPEEQGAMVEQDFESWSLRDLSPARLARVMIAGNGRQPVAS